MSISEAYNTRSLNHWEERLKKLVDEQYDLCLYKCAEKTGPGYAGCKDNCFRNVIVPFRFMTHAAKDEEDNLYRKCLSEKFPNIQQTDYVDCTNKLYKDRMKVLSDHFANVTEGIFTDLH
jgi:hypothetical protein